MNCFQIIKSVLDEAYNQIAEDESEKDQQIKDALEYLTIEYRKLSKKMKVILFYLLMKRSQI